MKKILSIIVLGLLSFLLVACNSSGSTVVPNPKGNELSVEEAKQLVDKIDLTEVFLLKSNQVNYRQTGKSDFDFLLDISRGNQNTILDIDGKIEQDIHFLVSEKFEETEALIKFKGEINAKMDNNLNENTGSNFDFQSAFNINLFLSNQNAFVNLAANLDYQDAENNKHSGAAKINDSRISDFQMADLESLSNTGTIFDVTGEDLNLDTNQILEYFNLKVYKSGDNHQVYFEINKDKIASVISENPAFIESLQIPQEIREAIESFITSIKTFKIDIYLELSGKDNIVSAVNLDIDIDINFNESINIEGEKANVKLVLKFTANGKTDFTSDSISFPNFKNYEDINKQALILEVAKLIPFGYTTQIPVY